jgi:GR25 family glycosyltransferase involved in LPS biosynthesis
MKYIVYFLYINLDRCENRKRKIENMFKQYNINSFERIRGIDYNDKLYEQEIRELIPIKKELLGRKLFCNIEGFNKKVWTYDGDIKNSWPNMPYDCRSGEKGLILSYIKALKKAKEINTEFICILEDDAWFSEKNFYRLKKFLLFTKCKVLFLDERQKKDGSGVGCAGMIFHKSVIDKIIQIIEPLSPFKIYYQKWNNILNLYYPKMIHHYKTHVNLDLFFNTYFSLNKGMNPGLLKIIKSDYFPTTIQNT